MTLPSRVAGFFFDTSHERAYNWLQAFGFGVPIQVTSRRRFEGCLRILIWPYGETRMSPDTTKMGSAGNGDAGCCSILKKLGLQPVTRCSLAKFYAPAFGAASYTAMSVNVMNPSLVVKVFPRRDITNLLLVGALTGTGMYLYTREHMKSATQPARIVYRQGFVYCTSSHRLFLICLNLLFSAAGAVLLSFGSVLVWAVLRSIVPPNPVLCTIAGVGTGVAFLKIGTSYIEFVDGQIAKK
ncbi:hypothetical protein DMN91_007751 [Ooceraea biroi]|uniref:Transmembrane protein n=1 Tax=Ooceraea biroi TaxID=2015173 RepID=A0A3L8DFM3_OOCBI|nr:hypothetical protein DMN91_007751 [Ooceraea biroi]